MKPGHSIPKIQGLCNWSGSTVCPCVRVSLYVVEIVWLCNTADIIAANKIQRNLSCVVLLKDNWPCTLRCKTTTQTRSHFKVSDHLWIKHTEATCQSPWNGLETEQIKCAPSLTSARPCYTPTHSHMHRVCSDDNTPTDQWHKWQLPELSVITAYCLTCTSWLLLNFISSEQSVHCI